MEERNQEDSLRVLPLKILSVRHSCILAIFYAPIVFFIVYFSNDSNNNNNNNHHHHHNNTLYILFVRFIIA